MTCLLQPFGTYCTEARGAVHDARPRLRHLQRRSIQNLVQIDGLLPTIGLFLAICIELFAFS